MLQIELCDGWGWKSLDELIALIRNGTTATQNQDAIGFPVSRIQTIQNYQIDKEKVRHVEDETVAKNYRYNYGDILFSHINSFELVGKVAIYEGDPEFLVHGMNLLQIQCNKSLCWPKYLYWYLRSSVARSFIEPLIKRAIGQASINQTNLKSINVAVPYPDDPTRSLTEQRRIVARIEALFAELRGCQQTLSHLQKQTGRLMEAFIEEMASEFTEHRIPLIEILHSRPRNGWSPKVTDDSSGTPVLRLGAVLNFEYDPSQVKYTALPTEPDAHYWLEPGDVMISRSNTANLVAHASIYNGAPYPCICPDLLMKMKVKKEIADPQFLIYWLQCSEVRKHIASRAKGASPTMKKVNQQDVMEIPFPKLSLEEQRRRKLHLNTLKRAISDMQETQAADTRNFADME